MTCYQNARAECRPMTIVPKGIGRMSHEQPKAGLKEPGARSVGGTGSGTTILSGGTEIVSSVGW